MAESDTLSVFLIAGEESGDRLGAALMRALMARTGGRVRFVGIGGDQMAGEGLQSLFPLADTSLIGFASVPSRAPRILRRVWQATDAVVEAKPDVLVIIDSPEFTHRIAQRVRKRAPTIPIVDYVSPSVWAWRPGRARAMRGYIDHVLALLPFEPAVHARLGGPPCSYVGHPLSERTAALRPNAEEQRRRDAPPPILLVMPGSRRSELNHMLECFGRAAERVAQRVGAIEIVVPAVPALAPRIADAVSGWRVPARVVVDSAGKDAAIRMARAAIVKSGTSTLELALAGVPMVAAYRLNGFEAFVMRRLIKAPSVILANLVLGENVVPELLQENLTAQRLADMAIPLLGDKAERRAQRDAFARLDAIMEIGAAKPSDRAAQVVLDVVTRRAPG